MPTFPNTCLTCRRRSHEPEKSPPPYFSGEAKTAAAGANAIGQYLLNFIPMSLYTAPGIDGNWLGSWTVFYWAWFNRMVQYL